MDNTSTSQFNVWKAITLGIIVWLVPFLSSFLFHTPSGDLVVDEVAFKTAMLLVSTLTGSMAIFYFFRSVNREFLKLGLNLGIVWLLINWLLDLLTLVLMFNEPVGTYFVNIGLRHLNIPMMTVLVGAVAARVKITTLKEIETTPEVTEGDESVPSPEQPAQPAQAQRPAKPTKTSSSSKKKKKKSK